MNKRIVMGITCGLWILALTGCGSKHINLNDYYTYEVEGYNGHGKIVADFDDTAFLQDLRETAKVNTDSMEALALELVSYDLFSGTWTQTTDLSNGDVVVYSWDIPNKEALKEKYHIIIDAVDIEVNVKNLEEIVEFDAFEGVEFIYGGYSSKGTLTLSTEHTQYPELPYFVSGNSNLSNGDTIRVSISSQINNMNTMDYCVEHYGTIPEALSKEYIVTELPELVKEARQLNEESVSELFDAGIAAIHDYTAENWVEGDETLNGVTPVEMYLIVPQELSLERTRICCVYEIDVKNTLDEFTYYTYVSFEEPVASEDGTLTRLPDPVIPQGSAMFGFISGEAFMGPSGKYYYIGYRELDALRTNVAYKAGYSWEKIR